MPDVLKMPADELIAAVEEVAASGDRRAEKVLLHLLAEQLERGDIGVIPRLTASPYVDAGR